MPPPKKKTRGGRSRGERKSTEKTHLNFESGRCLAKETLDARKRIGDCAQDEVPPDAVAIVNPYNTHLGEGRIRAVPVAEETDRAIHRDKRLRFIRQKVSQRQSTETFRTGKHKKTAVSIELVGLDPARHESKPPQTQKLDTMTPTYTDNVEDTHDSTLCRCRNVWCRSGSAICISVTILVAGLLHVAFDVSKTDNLVALDCERTRPLNLVLILAIFGHISAVILSQPVFSGEKATTAITSSTHPFSRTHYSTSTRVGVTAVIGYLKVYAKKIASAACARTIQRKTLTGTPATK